MIWIVFALLTGVAVMAVLAPLAMRGPAPDARAADVAFFEAQIAEIDRDAGAGRLDPAEAAAARAEAGRRLLRVESANDAPASQPRDKFEDVFGSDPRGGPAALAARQDTGEAGRWRRFTREQIAQRGDNLDIAWLKDSGASTTQQDSENPARVAGLALRELNAAVTDLRALLDELGEDPDALLDSLLTDEAAEPEAVGAQP